MSDMINIPSSATERRNMLPTPLVQQRSFAICVPYQMDLGVLLGHPFFRHFQKHSENMCWEWGPEWVPYFDILCEERLVIFLVLANYFDDVKSAHVSFYFDIQIRMTSFQR